VSVGLSMDGPPEVHDAMRVDHRGRGSYAAVVRAARQLQAARIPLQILSVLQLGADSVSIHQHFADLGAQTIGYLLPDYTHDTIAAVRERHGAAPCAAFLLPLLDQWWTAQSDDPSLCIFTNMARLVLGGDSVQDIVGGGPFRFVFVETDGAIEGLDVLRVCGSGFASARLNVLENDFSAVEQASRLHWISIHEGTPLPAACSSCQERHTCAGGYLPHRFSSRRGFNNPTVWCADMLLLLGRLRELMEVPPAETALRRSVLLEMGLVGARPQAMLAPDDPWGLASENQAACR